MKTKEKMINALQELPDEASIEDAMERLLFLSKVERGLYQANAGNTISHAQVKERMAKWLK
jgi:predicted transcriptional regulator